MPCRINGRYSEHIPVQDRGYQYGDGVFETVAIINQIVHNYDLHMKRLLKGCQILQLNAPEPEYLAGEVKTIISDFNQPRAVLKIQLSRNASKRGYSFQPDDKVNLMLTITSMPEFTSSYYKQGIDVQLSDFQLSIQKHFQGIKHLNRLEQIMAQSLLKKEFNELVLFDTNDHLVSGISANIYFADKQHLYFPQIKGSGIKGTVREQIKTLCVENDIEYKVGKFTLQDLIKAKEIFYSNSIRGLWPVKQITMLDNQRINFKPGEFYHYFSRIINAQLNHI